MRYSCFYLTTRILGEIVVALIGSAQGVLPSISNQVVQIGTLTILILRSFPVVAAATCDYMGRTYRIG